MQKGKKKRQPLAAFQHRSSFSKQHTEHRRARNYFPVSIECENRDCWLKHSDHGKGELSPSKRVIIDLNVLKVKEK